MTTAEFCGANCVERRGTNTLKWDSLKEIFGDADLTPLWVADMEFKSPPGVIEALKSRVDHGAFGYGKVPDSYYEAFNEWQQKNHGMTVEKDEVRFYTGVVGALYALVNTFTQPKDAAIICPPVYYPFYDAILNTGRTLVTCELDNNDGIYSLDFEKFEKDIKDNNVKLFILCSPHNPVSRVWTEAELDKMMDICRRNNVLVISDEIHQDFAHKGNKFIPAAVLGGGKYKDMLITVNSASKTFNLAGLIHSHTLIHNPDMRQKYDDYIKTIGQPEANLFGLVAMEAAYRTGGQWIADLKATIYENYEHVKSEFGEKLPKVIITPLEGTYLMWLDMRAYLDPDQVEEFMRDKCRLAVDVGEWFSVNGKGFIRINLATNPKYVKLAVNNIITNLIQ